MVSWQTKTVKPVTITLCDMDKSMVANGQWGQCGSGDID